MTDAKVESTTTRLSHTKTDSSVVKIGTVTWNIGKGKKTKLPALVDYINQENNGSFWENDIIVFAFQEVRGGKDITAFGDLLLQTINNKIGDNDKKLQFDACRYNSACTRMGSASKFSIFLIALTKNSFSASANCPQNNSNVSVCPVSFSNPIGTKGFTSINVEFLFSRKSAVVKFWSVHFPFNSTDYAKGIEGMLVNLENDRTDADHEVLLGDVNSRSCWLPGKPGTKCTRDIPIGQPVALQTILNSIESDSRKYAQDKLIQNDFLDGIKTKYKWKEQPINFMPTYKVDNNGFYKLESKGQGRLSGYPDRILYRNNNQSKTTLEAVADSYTSLSVKGNDHFPVTCKFELSATR